MSLIKKITSIIIFAGVGLAALTPFICGLYFQKEYNHSLDALNSVYAGKLKFEGSFTKGYIRAHAKTKITNMVAGGRAFEIKHDILLGPAIINFKGWGDASSYHPRAYKFAVVNTTFDDNVNSVLAMAYGGKPAYSIISEFNFDGTGVTYCDVNPLNFAIMPGMEFDWQGLAITLNNTKNFGTMTIKYELPLLHFSDVNGTELKEFKVTAFTSDQNFTTEPMKGVMSMHLANAFAVAIDHNIFDVTDAKIHIKSEKQNDTINLDGDFSLKKIKLTDTEYGPLTLLLGVTNLSYKALEDIAESTPSSSENGSKDMSAQIPPEQILALLASRPNLHVDLKLDMPQGKIDLLANLAAGSKDLSSAAPEAIAATMSTTATMKVSKLLLYQYLAAFAEKQIKGQERDFALANKVPGAVNPYTLTPDVLQTTIETWIIPLLDNLKQAGVLVESKDQFSIDIAYDKNVLKVNGQTKQMADIMALQKFFVVHVNIPEDSSNNNTANPPPTTSATSAADSNKITVVPAFQSTTKSTNIGTGSKASSTTPFAAGAPAAKPSTPKSNSSTSNTSNSNSNSSGRRNR